MVIVSRKLFLKLKPSFGDILSLAHIRPLIRERSKVCLGHPSDKC